MPDVPYFTIVVATFNRGRHIVPTIEAALEQTFTDFELLVVGDGLTDDTLDQVPRTTRVSALSGFHELGQSGEAEQCWHRGSAWSVHCLSRPR